MAWLKTKSGLLTFYSKSPLLPALCCSGGSGGRFTMFCRNSRCFMVVCFVLFPCVPACCDTWRRQLFTEHVALEALLQGRSQLQGLVCCQTDLARGGLYVTFMSQKQTRIDNTCWSQGFFIYFFFFTFWLSELAQDFCHSVLLLVWTVPELSKVSSRL